MRLGPRVNGIKIPDGERKRERERERERERKREGEPISVPSRSGILIARHHALYLIDERDRDT